MKKHNNIYLSFYLIIGITAVVQAQPKKVTSTNFVWMNDYVTVKLNDKWKLYFDGSYRRKDWLNEMSQIKLNPGITYSLNKQLSFTTGFCYFLNYTSLYNRPEYRPWEQVQYTQQIHPRIAITNRIRIEQRFSQMAAKNELINDYNYNNRYRYQLGFKIAFKNDTIHKDGEVIKKTTTADNSFFVIISDEIMFNSGKEIKYNYFDQNRITGGIGYKLNKHFETTVTYMYDYIKRNAVNTFEKNNVVMVNLYQNF